MKVYFLICSHTACSIFVKNQSPEAFQSTEFLNFLNKAFIVKHLHDHVVENSVTCMVHYGTSNVAVEWNEIGQ